VVIESELDFGSYNLKQLATGEDRWQPHHMLHARV
jgi:hypothetical protein